MSQTASKESFDILVAGAGTAGVCAAIQAARAGASVCLVEKNGIPGGTITAAGIAYPGIFHAWGKQVIAGIGWELVERTRQESRDPLPNLCDTNLNEHWRYQVQIDPVIFAALCDEEFEKAGVTVKYHTMIGAAETAADGVGLTLCGKDGLYPVFARRVIDCTGDANLSKLLGRRAPHLRPLSARARSACMRPATTRRSSISMRSARRSRKLPRAARSAARIRAGATASTRISSFRAETIRTTSPGSTRPIRPGRTRIEIGGPRIAAAALPLPEKAAGA